MPKSSKPAQSSEGAARRGWKQDPEAVKANILKVAYEIFARSGLSGARIEEIAHRTETSKRMIYYYFGDKDGLYRAVLESAYIAMRKGEDLLDLGGVPPVEALRRLAEFTFDHHRSAEDFVRLVMIENVHDGRHMSMLDEMAGQNISVIRLLEDIYQRGCAAGLFRRGLDAVELHWMISSMSYFNVSNRVTFSQIFGNDLFNPLGQQKLRRHVGDMMVRFVLRDDVSLDAGLARSNEDIRMINPDIYRFLEVWDSKWASLPKGASVQDRRLKFEAIAREMRLPTPEGVETDGEYWIESDGGPVRVRVFRAAGTAAQPALIYLHGGAWMQGSPETHWDITARIAGWNGQTVISVDYGLAPENPYPTAFQQVFAVTQWAHREAGTLNIDPAKIAIGGDSAGGNIAAAVALKCREEGVALSAQLLIYPACDFDQTRPSYIENADGPLLKVQGMDGVNRMYSPDESKLSSDPFVAPLVAESHADLPPAYVAVAQNDPLRDSGVAYADALEAAGVPVTRDSGEGLIHGYLRSMEYCALAEDKLRAMAAWLRETNA
ncbi:alpha/beta hydrolase fold domain-containing protein [Aquimixticola soesokkakensis]|uniref:alpha/beta hydrolase fold domain-containing protein n=1 Tax=Aquimixticola soesokkakensis TaxID=1519096 RepID=UPI0035226E18